MPTHAEAIESYLQGPALLRRAVAGMTTAQLDARPIPGRMSTREVVCHIADFEPVYADRMKRVLAEDQPSLPGGDPEEFRAALAYVQRDIDEELALVEIVRRQMARILQATGDDAWSRTGNHAVKGPLSVAELLAGITAHIPHHIAFIKEKRAALG